MKPRVLIFIDWFLPGYKAGGPITSNANMVDHLRHEVDFFILTRNIDYCAPLPYSTVVANQWVSLKEGVSVYYFSSEHLTIKNLRKVANEAHCDSWYINGIYSIYFSILPLVLAGFSRRIRVTISARGMLSPHALAVKGWEKKCLLLALRLMGFYRKTSFHATNSAEAAEIAKQVGKNAGILIAPNLSKPLLSDNYPPTAKVSGVLNLVSLARISPEKNTLGALELLSQCNQHKISFDWYGQTYDEDYMQACIAVVQQMPENIRVNFKESIPPSEIPAILHKAHFLFLPTRGENFGHAILEAFTAGCPVIISDQTPWRSLEPKGIGWDIPLDKPEQFVRAIESAAAMDQESFNRMSLAAKTFAKEFTSDPAVLDASRKLFFN